MREVTFEHYKRSKDIASTLRYMKGESMWRTMRSCRLEGEHRVVATFYDDMMDCDIRNWIDQLSKVFGLSCLVTWESE